MNKNKKMRSESSKNIKDSKMVPQSTKGEGDCPFHAALGSWNSVNQQFETDDIVGKRKKVAEAIRNCKPDSALFPLIKAAIMELVMRGINIQGETYKKLKETYKNYVKKDNELIKSKWDAFEKQLNKYSSVIEHIRQFTEEYITNKNLDESNITRLRASLHKQFQNCENEEDDTLRALILSLPVLDKAYLNYKKPNQGIDIDQWFNLGLLKEYANFILILGQWLLPCELNIIAYVFDISIDYYAVRTANVELVNPGRSNKVLVCFNGHNHYERMASEQEISQFEQAILSEAQKQQDQPSNEEVSETQANRSSNIFDEAEPEQIPDKIEIVQILAQDVIKGLGRLCNALRLMDKHFEHFKKKFVSELRDDLNDSSKWEGYQIEFKHFINQKLEYCQLIENSNYENGLEKLTDVAEFNLKEIKATKYCCDGINYIKDKELETAKKSFMEATKIFPELALPKFWLAIVNYRLGSYQETIDICNKFTKNEFTDSAPDYISPVCTVYLALKLATIRKFNLDYSATFFSYADFYYYLAKAQEKLNENDASKGNYHTAYFLRGNACFAKGYFNEALTYYDLILKDYDDGNPSSVYYRKALVLFAMGNSEKAFQELEEAIELADKDEKKLEYLDKYLTFCWQLGDTRRISYRAKQVLLKAEDYKRKASQQELELQQKLEKVIKLANGDTKRDHRYLAKQVLSIQANVDDTVNHFQFKAYYYLTLNSIFADQFTGWEEIKEYAEKSLITYLAIQGDHRQEILVEQLSKLFVWLTRYANKAILQNNYKEANDVYHFIFEVYCKLIKDIEDSRRKDNDKNLDKYYLPNWVCQRLYLNYMLMLADSYLMFGDLFHSWQINRDEQQANLVELNNLFSGYIEKIKEKLEEVFINDKPEAAGVALSPLKDVLAIIDFSQQSDQNNNQPADDQV